MASARHYIHNPYVQIPIKILKFIIWVVIMFHGTSKDKLFNIRRRRVQFLLIFQALVTVVEIVLGIQFRYLDMKDSGIGKI
tara:strand:- start:1091 stop:1333 length:243 start_codon:yes stop_codon:yes gene_type:complete